MQIRKWRWTTTKKTVYLCCCSFSPFFSHFMWSAGFYRVTVCLCAVDLYGDNKNARVYIWTRSQQVEWFSCAKRSSTDKPDIANIFQVLNEEKNKSRGNVWMWMKDMGRIDNNSNDKTIVWTLDFSWKNPDVEEREIIHTSRQSTQMNASISMCLDVFAFARFCIISGNHFVFPCIFNGI